MKILILGGTRFLGRHVLDVALARGHVVTLFNRGRSREELPAGVHLITGDRERELDGLRGRHWDAVVDTSGYLPEVVRRSVALLADAAEQYVFVSSLSVYAGFSAPRIDERTPVIAHEGPPVALTSENYGALKAAAEIAAEEKMPGRVLVVRAGMLVGPRDDIGRFTYWARRIARGGTVLAPGRPDRHVQLVDARDVAEWIVKMAEVRQAGVYNVTGPAMPLTMEEMLTACGRVSGSDARLVWASDAFLLENGVAPWTELPFWLPEVPEYRHFFDVDASKAISAGLGFRPLAETIAETLEWAESKAATASPEREFGIRVGPLGLAPERERELLARHGAARADLRG